MADLLYSKTEEELQRARRLIRSAGFIALGTILFLIVFLLFAWIVQLKGSYKVGDIILGFVGGGLCLSGGLALIGGSTIREDREVREHTGDDPISYPLSHGMRTTGWFLLLFSAGSIIAGFVLASQE